MTILEQFLSDNCPACGAVKEKNTAFCKKCYFALPRAMKAALWKRFGSGFEDAQRAGLAFLRGEERSLFQ